ncbi:MAG: DUF4142 domain-containing protein [Myxococcota bacterium]|nr:DUF4142 domain-containing protein [Myxococcota bacterium]
MRSTDYPHPTSAAESSSTNGDSTGTNRSTAQTGSDSYGGTRSAMSVDNNTQVTRPPSGTSASDPNSDHHQAGQNVTGATNAMGADHSPEPSSLDDGQIAAAAQAINDGEIQEAALAETKASSADVKGFARQMATDHRAILNKVNATLSRQKITPSDSWMSTQLKSDAQSELATLKSQTSNDFDREYVDAQVRGHQHALDLIDRMLPAVKSAELKAQLQAARPIVALHLRHAEGMQQTLQQGTNKTRGTSNRPSNPEGQPSGSPSDRTTH